MLKKKQVEEQIRSYESEISSLREQVAKLEQGMAQYREKEQAIISALTEAQTSASRLVLEARAQVKSIYDEADVYKAEAERQAQSIKDEASGQAARIVEDAQAEAQRRVARAQEEMAAVRTASESFLVQLEQAAREAQAQAEAFAAYNKEAVLQARIAFPEQERVQGEEQQTSEPLPEDYENPAELIHSIYKLQGRDIPETAEEPEDTQRVWTVDEVVDSAPQETDEDITGVDNAEFDANINDVLKFD